MKLPGSIFHCVPSKVPKQLERIKSQPPSLLDHSISTAMSATNLARIGRPPMRRPFRALLECFTTPALHRSKKPRCGRWSPVPGHKGSRSRPPADHGVATYQPSNVSSKLLHKLCFTIAPWSGFWSTCLGALFGVEFVELHLLLRNNPKQT